MFLPAFQKDIEKYKKALIIFTLPELNAFSRFFRLKKAFSWLNLEFYPLEDKFIVIGPVFSAPVLGFVMKLLSIAKIEKVLGLGWAGATKNLPIPSIFLPEKALSFEGVSNMLYTNNISPFETLNTFSPDEIMLNNLKKMLFNIPYTQGKILSTDYPFFFEDLAKKNLLSIEYPEIIAIDMETSALFSLSKHFGIKACAIHFLIDRVGENSFTIPAEIKNLRKKLFPQIKKFLET